MRILLATLAVLVSTGAVADAQVAAGTISGTVRDGTQAAVAGADVTITETDKGITLHFLTSESGSYQAPSLNPGTYTVSIRKEGFKEAIQSAVNLQVDQTARVDFVLELGSVTDAINVTGAPPIVQADTSEMGQVIAGQAVQELPLNGRNFAQLVYLVPGVTPGIPSEALSGASALNPRGASNFNPLGQSSGANGWLVDGIDNNEYTFNTIIVMPSVEAVREFKVLTGSYSAEFGRGAGVVSIATKSGSNQLHGAVFEFLRNSAMDAKQYFQQGGTPIPPFRRNQFGAAAGGPVVFPKIYNGHARTFFFMDYAGWRELQGNPYVNTVPTASTRTGDFSNYTNNGSLILIYDPLSTRLNPSYNPNAPVTTQNPQYLRDQFAGNKVPIDHMNPVGLNVASIYPLPNAPGNFNNYTAVVNRVVDDNEGSIRIDHQVSGKNTLFSRFTYDAYALNAPQAAAKCCLPTPASAHDKFDLGPYVAGTQVTTLATSGAVLSDTHVFRPNLLNEIRIGYSRTNPYTVQSDLGHQAATSLGIQGINISQPTTGIPNMNITNLTGLSGGPTFIPVNNKQTNLEADDSIFWTHGRHNVKTGFHYLRRLLQPFVNINTRSTLTFSSSFTNNPVTNTQGTGLATLLTGYLTSGTRGFLLTPYYITTVEPAAYIQDDIKISQRLTLNLGIRWEAYVPPKEIRNRLVNFDTAALVQQYAGENGVSEHANVETRWNNFAPRIGLAWDFLGDGKTVLRTGFGIAYYPLPYSANGQLGLAVPYTVNQNFTSPTNPTDWTAVPSINNPFPPISIVKPLTTAELNAANPQVIGWVAKNQTPYTETFTLDIQRQLTSSLLLQIGYGGARGLHQTVNMNINEVEPGPGSLASKRLIQPLSNVSSISLYGPASMSTYHSGQVKLDKQFSHGAQFLFAYTYGKSLDFLGYQTVTNRRGGYGASSFDVKHRAVASGLWDIPTGGLAGLGERLLGGWQLSGIVTATTGLPFNVTLQTGVNNGAPSWPNRIASGVLSNPDPSHWFDSSAFVAPPPNTYGNVAKSVLYGPGHLEVDTSLVKNIKIRERAAFQIRFEAFNLFNSPYFAVPNAAIGSPTVGQITATVAANRNLEAALKLTF